ncbi:hypothetical protein [Plantactinospora sp. B5E13]|uniref:hypothetical protein n=1 Tax=unclassified Plantactinospora TaxID=2631981 RepID=UPI00325D666C
MEAVLFDMDDTPFDSEPLRDVSLDDLAKMSGGTLSTETRRRVVGGSLRDIVRTVHDDLGVEADVEESVANSIPGCSTPWSAATG